MAASNLVDLLPHVAHALHKVVLDAGTHMPYVLIEF